ncbi:MAG TPA: molybdenum cofactor biosynthesis protein MoaE [Candidatus Acidoferrales bacterium]|nr:molybdenum cofactor biosynthesis protein MoaE [Candidatus Acidoferrales bacterium]
MRLAIVREPIDVERLRREVERDDFGGVTVFVGVVRCRDDDGRSVTGLSYEAFEPMAIAAFEAIAGEARERWSGVALAIEHRIGDLSVGEVAVAVAAAAVHREAAFAACRYAIDQLKQRAPIWKKERYADGSGRWKENACGR